MWSRTMIAATGAAVLLAGCGAGDGDDTSAEQERTPIEDGTFRGAITGDPGNLDPHMTVLSITRWVTTFMYDSLIFIDEDGEAVPYLAESWDVELDRVTYTLKDGITCTDGTELTASDVAENVEFVADPANESPQLGVWVQPGVTATADDDARTVTITSPGPDPFLLQGSGLMQIVCPAGMADRSILEEGSSGTGMFELVDFVAGDHYTFERRDEYAWGPEGASAADPGTPQTVTLDVVANESTAANMFLAGDLDVVDLTGADIDRVEQSGAARLELPALFGELFFNQTDGRPGADPAVRQALAHATDFEAVGMALTDGRGQPAEGLGVLDPQVCSADTVSETIPEHDVEAAEALLDDAGWEEGSDGVRSKNGEPLALSLTYLSEMGPGVSAGSELLAQQWEAVGARVELEPITQTQINEVVFGSGDWDAALIRLTVAFPSQLIPFFSGPVPPEGTNFAHLDNEEYQELTAQAAQLPVEEGCPLWEDADRALVSNADVIPFVDEVRSLFLDGVEVRLLANNYVPPSIRLYE
ncbi:ABC transporter substrate-binding protein [Actinobacteria bacterium YIM 96077]|uniref:ABC transporter substrate-binding protein n=1 Tax=Phytoactinopolyspora halophila TaxID=1981511 RepID=A0A329R6C7_9ACTN|nr:ABC transporter substrate-binding protein [Phytoactinopolyspora halophila]AYY12198.1 ABC transporter substrate-binding protein [Actinobacteria bacterium YIM 96077]RAW18568.1 ABC transporter substrate-binding protein [Phytoactinopolyspora halophila]